jgi:hypothetical protein
MPCSKSNVLRSTYFQCERRCAIWNATKSYVSDFCTFSSYTHEIIDVLSRCLNIDEQQQTVHIMRYIFPHQFRLRSIFTSRGSDRDTVRYTLREKEIHQALELPLSGKRLSVEQVAALKMRLPKRLRREPTALVDKLRRRNQKCSYTSLLQHYCSVKVIDFVPC